MRKFPGAPDIWGAKRTFRVEGELGRRRQPASYRVSTSSNTRNV